MALGLLLCVLMIAVLVGVIAVQGMSTFWPRPIERITTRDGQTFLGVRTSEESYLAPPSEARQIEQLSAEGTLLPGSLDAGGRPLRRLYRVGNRDIGQDPFRWVPVHSIASVDRPADAVLVERESWGIWLGTIRAVVMVDDLGPGAELLPDRPVRTDIGPGTASRVISRDSAGGETVLERTRVPAESLTTPFGVLHTRARERRDEIGALTADVLGSLNARLEALRLEARSAERRAVVRSGSGGPAGPGLSPAAWGGCLAAGLGLLIAGWWLRGRMGTPWGSRLAACAWIASAPLLLASALEHPWARAPLAPERLAEIHASISERESALRARYAEADARRLALERADARWRVEVQEPQTGRFAPRSLSEPGEPMSISSIVRVVPANALGRGGKTGIYASRWREFLTANPREVNTEGGVYPVIFGTVLLTLMLTVVVVPLGVVAAIYIREYARQGLVISIIRVAINNLAGVPSIVYGVFGLGFFCYTLGRYIDTGPESPMSAAGGVLSWWPLVIIAALILAAAAAMGLLAAPPPGSPRRGRAATIASVAVWTVCAGLVVLLIAKTPYFGGFFAVKSPSPTFGTRGILWASLTLALLTMPVVIVATEEAIAAVPRSMREGSHGCGATTWQTIRRIVLPGAAPGILTGAILAMARGAGEVAPLMLVGAAKQAPALPLSGEFPFIHGDRSFMHLGFHIYDLGLQSPDSEAARPLVWTTTLLLLLVVLAMNLAAIVLRARLRSRSVSSAT